MSNWRDSAGTTFDLFKAAAHGSKGMVATNHPVGSAAGLEMLAMGGNAIDAAIASIFALSVVEPMMVGPFGGGYINLKMADGTALCIDNYTLAPAAARPDMYRPVSDQWPDYLLTQGRESQLGYKAVGVPGNLKAWDEVQALHGSLDWEAVVAPALRHARHGFRATDYLCRLVGDQAEDIARFTATAEIFAPDGLTVRTGDLIVRGDYADTLEAISAGRSAAMYEGPLAHIIADDMAANGGLITAEDLARYFTVHNDPVTGTYRGFEVSGPPPGNSGVTMIIEMLNILEGFDVAGLGFGTVDGCHLLIEVLKIAFADRFEYLGDPATIDIPVDWLTSDTYAAERRGDIDMTVAVGQQHGSQRNGIDNSESNYTTHVTTADDLGNVVSMTQTINELFGSKVTVPGTGILLNNTQAMFDPHPGRPNSVAPGKRVVSSMAPTILSKDGRPWLGIGTPGGVRIFGSVMQAIVNIVDHGMTLQEAVEAPRLWTQGQNVEVEATFGDGVRVGLERLGHQLTPVTNVAGGMNGVLLDHETGAMSGAACWRADGSPAALSGGAANAEARFNPLI